MPGYTFVSVSTAKPGRLKDLARIASEPSEHMEGVVPGMIARQVGMDQARNAVVVWVTFDKKESLYNYLATDEGKKNHGDENEMAEVIETFEMYDLTPVSGRVGGAGPA